MADLSININGLDLKNPVLTASGTFGYGTEFQDFIQLDRLGGFIVKGTTLKHREGNPYPRMAETPSGMLNAVGLQNKGVDYFIKHIYPEIKDISTNILVNVSGSTIPDYVATAEKINALENIPGIELNISCPNVKEGGMAFGTSCHSAAEVVKAVRQVYRKHLMVKLSPNVTNIQEIALAAEAEGADSVSLINTILGMAIDAKKRDDDGYDVYVKGGRENTGIDLIEWVTKCEELGAGEILLTSMDADGTKAGYDIDMINAVCNAVDIPVIASGGCGSIQDIVDVFKQTNCDAALVASLFHFGEATVEDVRKELRKHDINVRRAM